MIKNMACCLCGVLWEILMQIESFFQKMSDGFEIFVNRWIPDEDVEIKGVICLCHGMMEHIMRYDKIATYFTEKGYVFNAYDQRGHGKTAQNAESKNTGKFTILAEKDGYKRVTEDLNEILEYAKMKYSDKKIILVSHSFGSLVTQNYLETFGDSLIDKCVLMGTSGPHKEVGVGYFINRIMSPFVNANKPSKFFNKLIFNSYQNHIPKAERKSGNEWLSLNKENVELYNMDSWCGKIPSFSFFTDLLKLNMKIGKTKNIHKISQNLPLLFMYGTEDPVGNYGKSIKNLINILRKNGNNLISEISYPNLRHELFNECEWENVCTDLIEWIEK